MEGFYLQLEEGSFSYPFRQCGGNLRAVFQGSHIDPRGSSAQSLSLCSLLGVESNEAELVRTKDDSQKDQPGPDPGAPLPEPVLRHVDLAAGGLSLVPDFASHQL